MKKLYSFLVFFTFVLASAQPAAILDYTVCDDNSNGLALFDLTSKDAEILFISNPAEYNIQYYQTLIDAESNSNVISNPSNFTNTSNPQQIFARATNMLTLDNFYYYFSLIVNPKPIAYPATLTFCDPTELPIYNLDDAIPQLVANQQNMTVTFYDSPTSGNVIVGGIFVPTIFPVQVLGATISDASGCVSEQTSITLNTNNCNACPAPMAPFSVSNVTSTTARLGWGATNGLTIFSIYLSVSGMPAPTVNTPATYIAQTATSPRSFVVNGLIPNTCYAFYVRTDCNSGGPFSNLSQWVGPFNFCTRDCENNGECDDNLTLIAFVDANTNGIKDSGEQPFDMGQFEYDKNNSGNPIYANSNNGTFIIFDNDSANTYDLNFIVDPNLANYYSASATYSDVNIPSGGGSHTYYFPVQQLQPYSDLEVKLIPSTPPRPGFTYLNTIIIKNKGTENIPSGTLTFTKANAVSIVSVVPGAQISTVTGFTFDFTNLAINEERVVSVTLQVPTIPTVNLGQVLTNSVSISQVADDDFPNNNSDLLSQTIVGSYDPNEKSESHGGKIALDTFTSDDYLTYTILFENTGTANAEFVRVEDLLDSQLEPDSVVMLNASHAFNMRRVNNKLVWNFYEINLPPTMNNPTLSHGFVQFKVKPKTGYAVGTVIPNAADIYFDFNPAIVTDPFNTEFVQTLGTSSFIGDHFYMYPNPSKTLVHIGLKDSSENIAAIHIRDVSGKTVKTISGIQSDEAAIDVSRFSKGIYFVEITAKNNLKTTKKLLVN